MKYLSLNLPGAYKVDPVAGMPTGGVGALESIISKGITILFIVAIILTLYFLIWGGIQWITSAGDKTKIEAARKRLIYAVIGLVVVLLAFMIVNIVGALFGVDFFE